MSQVAHGLIATTLRKLKVGQNHIYIFFTVGQNHIYSVYMVFLAEIVRS